MSLRTVALDTPRLCRSTRRLGADRLLGGHEVGDDGAQHLEATVVGTAHRIHLPNPDSILRGRRVDASRNVRAADRPVATSL